MNIQKISFDCNLKIIPRLIHLSLVATITVNDNRVLYNVCLKNKAHQVRQLFPTILMTSLYLLE